MTTTPRIFRTCLLTSCLMAGALTLTVGCSEDPNGGNPSGTGGGGGAGPGGTGGTSGGALGPLVGTALATFATDTEMFRMNDYADTNSKNLYAGMPTAVPTFSSTEGSPDPGSITVTANYNGYAQYVEFMKDFGPTAPQNWTGKTRLRVRVKVASGMNPEAMYPGGAIVSVQSFTPGVAGGADVWAYTAGTYTNIAMTTGWQEFTWSPPTIPPTGFDITKVRLIGIQLTTGGGGGTMTPSAAVIYVDSWTIE